MLKRLFSNNKRTSDYYVLVIDDDQPVRQIIVDILEDDGYIVKSALSGEEALKMLDLAPLPDALIVDLMMPEMNGQEFIERGRVRFGRNHFPPSLLLTAARHGETTANIIEVDDYLPKPFDHDILLQHVWNLIEKKSSYAKHV